MPNLSIRIPSDREPLVQKDARTGELLITRSWFLFLLWVFQRVGGATGDPIDTEDEVLAAVDGLLAAPPLAEAVTVDDLMSQLNAERERITQLERLVQDMRAAPVVL